MDIFDLQLSNSGVFKLLYKGMTINEMASILNKSYKQIDNAVQRVKGKIKKLLLNNI